MPDRSLSATRATPPLTPHQERPADPIASAVQRVAAALRRELPPGDIADLRRLRPDDPASPAFWKVLAAYVAPYMDIPNGDVARETCEKRWAVVLSAMAHLKDLLGGPPLGEALAACGYAELRFVRLLRARPSGLAREVAVATRYLAAKGQSVDPVSLARLVLTIRPHHGETVRRHIARAYYDKKSHQEKEA